ncbi:hypothetical protein AB205_0094980, partial [Aquarana catesbeiana]
VQCQEVGKVNVSLRCEFIRSTPDCSDSDGYISYLDGAFCIFPPPLFALAIFLYALWLLYLFIILAVTAEKFAVAAFSDSRTAGLAIGALFGAGVFVTTVVAGGIALVKPFTAASRPFLRDIVFYIAAIFLTFYVLYQGYVTLPVVLVYLLMYVAYVLVVVLSAWIYQRMRHRSLAAPSLSEPDLLTDSEEPSESTPHGSEFDALYLIQGTMPIWALLVIIGTPLAVIIFFTTKNNQPPKYYFLFSFLGFIASALWISAAATEIVNLLRTFGVVFRLSNTVLGLTLLAWGNSIGDFVSDLTLARQGYPRMAFSACFDVLIGVGLGCLLQMGPSKTVLQLDAHGLLMWILAGGLGISLVFSLVFVTVQCFHLRRVYGIALLVLYVVFLIVALLTEFGIIKEES